MLGIVFAPTLCIGNRITTDGMNTSSKSVEACRIEEFGAYNVLRDISQKAHVPIGLEAIQPKQEKTITLDFPGGTVGDILNLFVSQAGSYRWEESQDGIIHVFRNNARVALTNVVMSYPGAADKTRREIWQDLAGRPEVSAWMNSNHCSRGELLGGKEFRDKDSPVSINPGIMTVAQLLDQVAVKSGINYWAVLRSDPASSCRIEILLW